MPTSLPAFNTSASVSTLSKAQLVKRKSIVCCLNSIDQDGIQLNNVSYWRPNGRQILRNVSLNVRQGELAMLVGQNGCGKSTLMQIVRGLLQPTLGTVKLGRPAAFVDQNPYRQIVMPSVGADIAFFLKLPRDLPQHDARRRVLECLRSVGLEPAEKFITMGSFRLSCGQRQRVAVASALASNPKVLLMDEVTGSMDAENRIELVSRMRQLVSTSQVAALWITHLLEELDVADTIYVMRQGSVVASGPKDELLPHVKQLAIPDQYLFND